MSSEEQPSLDESPTGDPSEGGTRSGPEEGAATPGQGAEPGQSPSGGSGSNIEKNPDDWATGGEPMTGAQSSYLRTLSEQAGEPFDETLNKAQASKRIDELQQRTGRGR